jgi:hypothetical protein
LRATNPADDKQSSVVDTGFGLDRKKDYGKELIGLLQTQSNVSSQFAKTLQIEAYDTAYGIASYDGESINGLDYVKMHPAEEVNTNSLLYDAIRKFGKRNIAKTFGLSITEFLELPRDICDHLFNVALEVAKEKNDGMENVIDELTDK